LAIFFYLYICFNFELQQNGTPVNWYLMPVAYSNSFSSNKSYGIIYDFFISVYDLASITVFQLKCHHCAIQNTNILTPPITATVRIPSFFANFNVSSSI